MPVRYLHSVVTFLSEFHFYLVAYHILSCRSSQCVLRRRLFDAMLRRVDRLKRLVVISAILQMGSLALTSFVS